MDFDDLSEYTVIGASNGKEWWALDGINPHGTFTTVNFIVTGEKELNPLAQVQCIVHSLTPKGKARYVGTYEDYRDMTD